MNRRKFMFGGLLGVAAGVAATTTRASKEAGSTEMLACAGAHEPAPGYLGGRWTPVMLHTNEDGARALVPCRHCGVLFGVSVQHVR